VSFVSDDLDAQPGVRADAPGSPFYFAFHRAARRSTGALERRNVMRIISICALSLLCLCGCGHDNYQSPEYSRQKAICDKKPDPRRPGSGQFDIGPIHNTAHRPAKWMSQQMYLGDTCYVASIGPYSYKDQFFDRPAFYSLDVERRMTDVDRNGHRSEAWEVLYQRDLEIGDLPSGFERWKINEIVSYEELTRIVRFKIGQRIYEYHLPAP
jgi:hypothetical protein